MSKGDGQIIGIKFTDEIVTMSETPVGGYPQLETQMGNWSYNLASVGVIGNLYDGNITTYVDFRILGASIQIEFPVSKILNGIKVYFGSSYANMTGGVYGSNDGINFTFISKISLSGASAYRTATFENYKHYKFYKFVYTAISTRSYVYEMVWLYKEYKNEVAFKVTGLQKQHIGAPAIYVEYRVEKVLKHPTILDSIQLIMEPYYNRFNNTEDTLTIEYNKTYGDLLGAGGFVETFTKTFTPVELIKVPNPHVSDYVKSNINPSFSSVKIQHRPTLNVEKVNMTITPSFVSTKVGSNPL